MLSTPIVNKKSSGFISEEPRGKKHFNQAHKRTSLFGSENEPQYFENPFEENSMYPTRRNPRVDNYLTNENANKQSIEFCSTRQEGSMTNNFMPKKNVRGLINNEIHDTPLGNGDSNILINSHEESELNISEPEEEDGDTKTLDAENIGENPQSHINGKTEDSKINDLIQAAKDKAEQKEPDRQNINESPLLLGTSEKHNRNTEYQKKLLNAPWYTNPEEGIGSEDVERYDSRSAKLISSSLQKMSKSKSITQQDFPRYSLQELKECRQRVYHGNKESLNWPFREANRETNQGEEPNKSHYHRSSAVIGQGFMEKFGPKSSFINNKRLSDTPVAASTLRNSPYAFHG
ncbi:hypothetical protein MN116_006442 [Schistosoma mekongi]|uniref:Uncharacterized protein n=1 Tax=Schistosoma mekongi TaxID=38744 RepID=A0AAE2D5J1_SCHME|nr:hypothetical protein MN116_006442 [Schistosoma mekongi]